MSKEIEYLLKLVEWLERDASIAGMVHDDSVNPLIKNYSEGQRVAYLNAAKDVKRIISRLEGDSNNVSR